MARSGQGHSRFAHLQSVLDCIDGAYFVTTADPSSGNEHRICFVTEFFKTLTGYAAADVIGQPPGILVGCDPASPASRKFEKTFARHQKGEFTLQCRRRDGSRFQSAVSVRPVMENGRCSYIVAILHDAPCETEPVDADAVLESRFQRLADGLGEAVLIHRDKSPLFVNQAYVELFGFSSHAAALRETGPVMNLPPDCALEGRTVQCSAPRTDGLLLDLTVRSRTTDWKGRPATMLTMMRARNAPWAQGGAAPHRREPTDSEQGGLPLLRELLDSLPVILAHKSRDLVYTYVNKTYADWVDLPPNQIIGRHVSAVRNEAHFQLMKERREDVLAGKTVHYHTTCAYPGRGMRDLRMTLIPRFDPDGTIGGYFSLAQDITDLKEVERALIQREEQLRLIMDSMPALISYRDRNLRYQYVNRPYEEWHGVARHSMIGRHTCEFVSLDTFQRVKPYIDRVLAGEHVRYRAAASSHLGEQIIDVSFVPHKNETDHVVGFFALSQAVAKNEDEALAGRTSLAPDPPDTAGSANRRPDPVS